MLDKLLFAVQWFLVKINVVKTQGKTKNGRYIIVGVNRKNPISYIVVFIMAILGGLVGFFKEFYDIFSHSLKK
jgi:hypothetical protein